ncbi:MAG: helix-hairpin-helix domain-containing protein [Candidatus Aminicenantes bacterium]|nr:helix-hairpin-helix domain-containing protein [Candidatus Aminicenantes bacterium]
MTASRKSSLKELQTIPGVGPKIAANLWKLGIRSVADLRGRDPEALYQALGEREGGPVDRCALYVLRCAVYYASRKKHDPEKLKWWRWKDKV